MGTDIAAKIKEHQAKLPSLTRAEKLANKESVRRRASQLEEKAFIELGKLLSDRKTPGNVKKGAIDTILDRIAGKPLKSEDEKQTELSALDKMNSAELMEYITQQMSGMPLSARAIMVESLDQGLAFDAADIADAIAEPAASQLAGSSPAKGLPPLTSAPKPKREPRR